VRLRLADRWRQVVQVTAADPVQGAAAEEAYWSDYNTLLLRRWGLQALAPALRRRFGTLDPDAVVLFADTVPALQRLAQAGLRLGVYSNRPGPLQGLLARLGLAPYFSWVATAGEVGYGKPDPEAFRTAAGGIGVPPERLVYVGDSLEGDALGALRAGCRAVWLDRDGRGQAPPGVCTIRSLLELPGLLLPGAAALGSRPSGAEGAAAPVAKP
jgi:FMN phosphatase YigB (HAD superfamily)